MRKRANPTAHNLSETPISTSRPTSGPATVRRALRQGGQSVRAAPPHDRLQGQITGGRDNGERQRECQRELEPHVPHKQVGDMPALNQPADEAQHNERPDQPESSADIASPATKVPSGENHQRHEYTQEHHQHGDLSRPAGGGSRPVRGISRRLCVFPG